MSALEVEPEPTFEWVMTVAQAAATLNMHEESVLALLRRGALPGIHRERNRWLVDAGSVERYRATGGRGRGRHRGAVSAGPLVGRVEARGGFAACGGKKLSPALQKAYERAKRSGWMTQTAADQLAVKLLGLTPWELWGDGLQ